MTNPLEQVEVPTFRQLPSTGIRIGKQQVPCRSQSERCTMVASGTRVSGFFFPAPQNRPYSKACSSSQCDE
jgi:hypothetical protein